MSNTYNRTDPRQSKTLLALRDIYRSVVRLQTVDGIYQGDTQTIRDLHRIEEYINLDDILYS